MKIIRIITAILAIIIVIGVVVALNFYVFGEVPDVSTIAVLDLSVKPKKVSFTPVFMSGANIMGGYLYQVKDDIMYITIRSVLVGGVGKESVEITGDFSTLQKIVLDDKKTEKIIWERQSY